MLYRRNPDACMCARVPYMWAHPSCIDVECVVYLSMLHEAKFMIDRCCL